MNQPLTESAVREWFPLMPDEVFKEWIAKQVKSSGWPFTDPEDQENYIGWDTYLQSKTPKFWSKVTWTGHKTSFDSLNFDQPTCQRIFALISFVRSQSTANPLPEPVPRCMERFNNCRRFIQENMKLPRPLICFDGGTAIKVLDGTHRLAAMIDLAVSDKFQVHMWLGANEA